MEAVAKTEKKSGGYGVANWIEAKGRVREKIEEDSGPGRSKERFLKVFLLQDQKGDPRDIRIDRDAGDVYSLKK